MNHLIVNNYTQSKKKQKIGFFLVALLFFFTSCSNHHCKEPMFVPLLVSFYSYIDTSQQVPPNFFETLEIKGIGNDSVFEKMERNGQRVMLLSLKKFENSTDFLITSTYNNELEETVSVEDTLIIKHTNTQEFVSAACGCLTTFRLDEVRHTRHNIGDDAIIFNESVISSIVTNYNEPHIKIYFKNY